MVQSQFYNENLLKLFEGKSYTWLVTGGAGFIGSHLVEALLNLNQKVVVLDNLSTGKMENIELIKSSVSVELRHNLKFKSGDIRDEGLMLKATKGVDFCLHQAALGSVPRSMTEPTLFQENNVNGFLNVLLACKVNKVRKIVYASSSSVYGDNIELPKVESNTGSALSPYALTKQMNELQARLFAEQFQLPSVGLRYFNVFGPRQDPNGAYAAVIPLWIRQLIKGEQCQIFGDGETSRDFCFVSNVVQANILAALNQNCNNVVFNVGLNQATTLSELHVELVDIIGALMPTAVIHTKPLYKDFRSGDIAHSLASIERIQNELNYEPNVDLKTGLKITAEWFFQKLHNR